MARPAGSASPPDHEPDARPDERVPAEQDRDRGGRRRRGQVPQPRVGDAVGEQQVRGEPVLGRRPGRLLGTEPVGQQHPRVDRAPRHRGGRGGRRARPARRARGACRGPRRPGAGRARASAGRAPRRARACARPCGAPAIGPWRAEVRPATISSASGSATTRRIASTRSETGPKSMSVGIGRPGLVSARRSGRGRAGRRCRPRAATAGAGRRPRTRRPRRASGAGRCRRRGPGRPRASRPRGRSRRRRPSSGCWRGPGDRRTAATATNSRRSAAVARGIAPEPEDDEAGRAIGTDQVAETPSERCIVGRPGDDPDIVRPGGLEPDPVALGERSPARRRPSARCGPAAGPGSGCRIRTATGRIERESSRRRRRSRDRARIAASVPTSASARTSAMPRRPSTAPVRVAGRPVRGTGSGASRGSTRPRRSASRTSPSSATRSSRSTSRPAPIRRPARRTSSPRSRTSSARSVASARERWGPRELDLDLLVFGRARLAIERPPEARSIEAESDPAKAAKLLEVPHPEARRAALRPGAPGRPRARPRAHRAGARPSRRRGAGRPRSRVRTPSARSASGTHRRGRWRARQPR